MNQDDIIRMARECGLTINYTNFPQVLHFADRVAASEREACAKVCEMIAINACSQRASECAAAIRARGVGDGT